MTRLILIPILCLLVSGCESKKEKDARLLKEHIAYQTGLNCKEPCPNGYEDLPCGDGLVRRRCIGCSWYYKTVGTWSDIHEKTDSN